MAASKTTFTAAGAGTGDWVTINGPFSVMRSGGSGRVSLRARAFGTTDEFTLGDQVEPGLRVGASVGTGVLQLRFWCDDFGPGVTPIICQIVQ
jgi:hypothetical protein